MDSVSFDELTEAISIVFNVPAEKIKNNGGQKGLRGRRVMCFIVEHDFKQQRKALAAYLSVAPVSVMIMAKGVLSELKDECRFLQLVNRVRKRVELPIFKPSMYWAKVNRGQREKDKAHEKKNLSGLLFGLKYTKEDDSRIQRAIDGAVLFFEKYGIGQRPKYISQ